MTLQLFMIILAGTFFSVSLLILSGFAGWYVYQRVVKKRTHYMIVMGV